MSSSPPPDVVVVAYGNDDALARCLAGVRPQLRTIVVDNSRDDDIEALTVALGCDYVRPAENVGFAAGVNLGLLRATRDADVLLLNPDAVITARDVLMLQHELQRDEGLAAVAPQLVDAGGDAQRVVWPLPSPGLMWRQAILGGDGRRPDGFLVGAVLLLRRKALNEIGMLDQRFFLYAEETDWQLRALGRGWRVGLVQAVTAVHIGAGTSSDKERRHALFLAGTETLIRKWYGSSGWASYRTAAVVAAALRASRPATRAESLARMRLLVRGPRRAAGLS